MKPKKLFVGLALSAMCLTAGAQQLAFPGAEGFGRFATGGRGGTIYHVTNLNDSGTGSLRDAVSQSNRIVVFDVSGVIKLKSGLVFSSNLTVLGQTAPGEGVQVYGDRVSFSGASNLIVRHMRFRMGKNAPSGQKDAAGVSNGRNMIFDHLSVLWGRDECFSISWDNKGTEPADITIQNSIIGQGLQTHSCGGLIQTAGGVTLYRNLYIENKTRNPKVKGLNQFVNNVVYNWGNGGCYLMGRESAGDSWADIENNYFVKGPWNSGNPLSEGNENFQFYGAGNYYDNNKDGELNGREITDNEYTNCGGLRRATLGEMTNLPKAFPEIVGEMTAEEALRWMIDSVGPSLPVRDEVDKYLVDEMKSFGTLGSTDGISDEKSLPHGGTGVLYPGEKPLDSDGDGIPDEWEIANNLNPNNALDAKAIAANGYANIENYVFSIDRAYPYLKNPSNLEVTKQEKESISLSWTDNADNESGYAIEYSTDNKTFTELVRVEANTTSYVANGLTPEQAYYFRVRAFGEDGLYSPYSNVLETETIGDPSAPKLSTNPSPADNEIIGTTASSVTFTWENTTKNYFGNVIYIVLLGTNADSLKNIGTVTSKSLTYSMSKLNPNTTYYWRVDARNNEGRTHGTVWTFKTLSEGEEPLGDTQNCCLAWGNMSRQPSDAACTKLEGSEASPSNNIGFSMYYTTATDKTFSKGSKMTYDFDGIQRTGITLSNGAQTAIQLPEGAKATKLTLWSVVGTNSSSRTSYWKEIAGNTYTETTTPVVLNLAATASAPNKAEYVLDNVADVVTFTNTGEQQSVVIVMEYHYGGPANGISSVLDGTPARIEYFTLSGERVNTPGKGLYIIRTTTASGKTTARKVMY
ncbi:fibronectin type III domain-containing protein [Prevotella sp. E2-28]|uniref:fibronectin type III domain-containing protein n=1 Tax=Prevotella sp. E2-28 TaxID=2913620 RepID=UPI001EDB0D24|nr:fibronectin type III domain-containing protein [Prevotella sp. E2-28]UKK54662.1 fibronectin type III domain-containing protein [Prevotella sp. E2-28]